jgi:DNA-binding MarR family transcriptional regulator
VVAEPTAPRPTQWLSSSEQDVWRRLLSVQCRLRERLDHDLRSECGLSLAEYDVLVQLSEAPGRALRMSELADRLLLSKSGLTRRVDGLVRGGLVIRRPCDDDGRGALAELTPAGWAHLERAAPVHVAGVRRYLFDPISDEAEPAGRSPRSNRNQSTRDQSSRDRESSYEPPSVSAAWLTSLARGLSNIEQALADG